MSDDKANSDTNGVMPVEREGTLVCGSAVEPGSPVMGDNVLARLDALRKSNGKPHWVNSDIYRLLYKRKLFVLAYERIKSSPGNMTPGTDKRTLDGFSMKAIDEIIGQLKSETFQFTRARKILIPKPNGGTRPLGIASPREKIVQEAIRIILESIYDSPHGSTFSEFSFGFRAGMGTHTALKHISQKWQGTTWFVEGDIKGCFDNINHQKLIEILQKRIKDQRFLNLIWKALTAGYLEFKVPVNSIVGTPQGSIISPILANIYMNELDLFVESLRKKYEKGSTTRKYSPEYSDHQNALRRARRALGKAQASGDTKECDRLLEEIRSRKIKLTETPVWNTDTSAIRIKYIRYADDWLIGVSGEKELAHTLKNEIEIYLAEELKLTLSREKTHIRHAKTEAATFLGTSIFVGSKLPRVLTFSRKSRVEGEKARSVTKRTTSGMVRMYAPIDRIVKRLCQKGFCDTEGHPISKPSFAVLDDVKIIEEYNAVLRGYLNYYSFVHNRANLRRIAYIMQFSAAKTLAHRHRTSMRKIFRKHGYRLNVEIKSADDSSRTAGLAYPLSWKANTTAFLTSAAPERLEYLTIQARFVTRSKIGTHCCICGSTEGVDMHHVKHVRKGGRDPNKGFNRIMSTLNRKQIPACDPCHVKIHNGLYDGISLKEFADPHLAAR